MEGRQNEVKKSIEDPNCIYVSNSHDDRHVYFSLSTFDLDNNKTMTAYTKTIVDISKNPAEVVSTFPSPSIKGNIKEEGLLYVKSKL